MESATVPDESTGSKTIADLLPKAVEQHNESKAVMYKDDSGEWQTETYQEVGVRVLKMALGLMGLGVQTGDKVSILANTRPEWTFWDFATLSVGGTVVPIYQTNSAEECQYVLENSEAKVVIVEDTEQLEKLRKVRDKVPGVEHVILMTGDSTDDALSVDDVIAKGEGTDAKQWQERYESVSPEDTCTIIYTSGTTGPPKGCVISHGNYRSMVDMSLEKNVLEEGELTYLFLPLAHSFALLIQLTSFDVGGTLAYWERDPLKIVPNLSEVKPTYFPSVPRIFEKMHTTITSGLENAGTPKKQIFHWAIGVGKKVREVEARGEEPGFLLQRQYDLAHKLALSKIQDAFGGNIKQCLTGAAPISKEILEFFHAADVLVLEGFGMTETSTAATINTPDKFKFGTVGTPFSRDEVKIAAEDGEILVKGPNVFQGYYNNEEATKEALEDGWLHTGDLGKIDDEGFLSISGRKKDIIITAGGKNITPSNFEGDMKQHRLVSQCVMVGDRRPYLTALVTLDPEEAEKYADEKDLSSSDRDDLANNDTVRSDIESHLEKVNEKYARVEQVKKFTVLEQDFTQEGDELTPTMKVKRNVVVDKYEGKIEKMYEDKN
ncbi:MAG: AMP-dependent synthetase/ligase [Solirubrobacterales bacterium]